MKERYRQLYTEEEVSQSIVRMASDITARHSKDATEVWDNPLFVTLLPGAAPFAWALASEIAHQGKGIRQNGRGIDPALAYMTTSRPSDITAPNTEMKILKDLLPGVRIKDRDAIILDSVFDMGITAETVREHLRVLGARSVELAVLVAKNIPRSTTIEPDYVGFGDVPNGWLLGMGMSEEDEAYRWSGGIYIVDPDEDQFQHATLG